jgi:hypothetical protein
MKRTILTLVVLTGVFSLTPILHAETETLNSDTGVIRVFVENEDGSPAANAPIYIADERKVLHAFQTDDLGSAAIDFQQGNYAVSSAQCRPIADSLDRYASLVAHVEVLPQHTTTVVLTLHLTDDAISNLSLSTLQKIGVSDEIAKYLN